MKSDKNCPDIRALVNVYYHWGSHWTPPGRIRGNRKNISACSTGPNFPPWADTYHVITPLLKLLLEHPEKCLSHSIQRMKVFAAFKDEEITQSQEVTGRSAENEAQLPQNVVYWSSTL